MARSFELNMLHLETGPSQGRGEARVIYCWVKHREVLLMLFIFKKNERSDLYKDQLKILKTITAKELQ